MHKHLGKCAAKWESPCCQVSNRQQTIRPASIHSFIRPWQVIWGGAVLTDLGVEFSVTQWQKDRWDRLDTRRVRPLSRWGCCPIVKIKISMINRSRLYRQARAPNSPARHSKKGDIKMCRQWARWHECKSNLRQCRVGKNWLGVLLFGRAVWTTTTSEWDRRS